MIYLGFDIDRQQHIVSSKGQKLICRNCDRTVEILRGLYVVSEKVCFHAPPFTHFVQYSHQAWSDLLSIAQ